MMGYMNAHMYGYGTYSSLDMLLVEITLLAAVFISIFFLSECMRSGGINQNKKQRSMKLQ